MGVQLGLERVLAEGCPVTSQKIEVRRHPPALPL
jgi:hypothetical protein